MSATEILEQIRRLPPAEQLMVAETVRQEFGDFDDELTPEQITELERRAAEARAHPERGIPLETLRAEMFAKYGVKQ